MPRAHSAIRSTATRERRDGARDPASRPWGREEGATGERDINRACIVVASFPLVKACFRRIVVCARCAGAVGLDAQRCVGIDLLDGRVGA